ncbi:cora-like Mg2+ transporter protein-domain-containing protein [Pseudoneurospora amorphoporcata]|uniref:Cora-like Mg2+ transporter protein-domain-containing protein n=1 Tax=Pseudoneurospora amorphoporcata TaxID=241081 RepID=A0AAN6NK68_9PEZI|nr:cora-like Mg2+ transporter protein-domain-containing protein [Pseudoneurospora amorphoporcata]
MCPLPAGAHNVDIVNRDKSSRFDHYIPPSAIISSSIDLLETGSGLLRKMSSDNGGTGVMPKTAQKGSAALQTPQILPPESSSIMSQSLAPLSWKAPADKKMDERQSRIYPEEYTRAVWEFSRFPDGSGENYTWLAWFLKLEPQSHGPYPHTASLVIQYPLGMDKDRPSSLLSSGLTKNYSSISSISLALPLQSDQNRNTELDLTIQKHDRYRRRNPISFSDPTDFYTKSLGEGSNGSQSGIIFLRGYMSAAWIKNIGARFIVDPEFFCRHMDFQNPDETPKNFSVPSLPSSSSHLIELPVMTIGIDKSSEVLQGKTIQTTRENVEKALNDFRERVTKINGCDMVDGESMIRDFYLFDGTHFAVEQRISICLEKSKDGKTFQLLVWLDSGNEYQDSDRSTSVSPFLTPSPNSKSTLSEPYLKRLSYPWVITQPHADRRYLPIALRRHKIALKSHLLHQEGLDPSARSAAHLPNDYGRSLHSPIMAKDAFYCLTEILNFAASSHMEFLNLIDLKLDQYISLPATEDFRVLPNLKYSKKILYRHIQKTERLLGSIRHVISSESRWPKASSADHAKSEKARITAQRIERDFEHLLNRAETLHRRTSDAIAVLMSSISISESQRAIEQAEDMGRLTFLAFLFVPLSLATSFFGMNFMELDGEKLSVWWWAVASPICLVVAVAGYYIYPYMQRLRRGMKDVLLRMLHHL